MVGAIRWSPALMNVDMLYIDPKSHMLVMIAHNIIEQCAFVHVDPENIDMGRPNLVQGN